MQALGRNLSMVLTHALTRECRRCKPSIRAASEPCGWRNLCAPSEGTQMAPAKRLREGRAGGRSGPFVSAHVQVRARTAPVAPCACIGDRSLVYQACVEAKVHWQHFARVSVAVDI